MCLWAVACHHGQCFNRRWAAVVQCDCCFVGADQSYHHRRDRAFSFGVSRYHARFFRTIALQKRLRPAHPSIVVGRRNNDRCRDLVIAAQSRCTGGVAFGRFCCHGARRRHRPGHGLFDAASGTALPFCLRHGVSIQCGFFFSTRLGSQCPAGAHQWGADE